MLFKTSEPFIRSLLSVSFPEITLREVDVKTADKITFSGTQWSGGYKNDYVVVKMDTLEITQIPDAPFLQRSSLHEQEKVIPPGFAVVVLSYCGTKKYLEIVVNPANMNLLITSKPELSEDELIVLYYTRCYKSSYDGISNYRLHQARQSGISAERWQSAKQLLISKKLLIKSGALSMDGKNIARQLDVEYSTGKVFSK